MKALPRTLNLEALRLVARDELAVPSVIQTKDRNAVYVPKIGLCPACGLVHSARWRSTAGIEVLVTGHHARIWCHALRQLWPEFSDYEPVFFSGRENILRLLAAGKLDAHVCNCRCAHVWTEVRKGAKVVMRCKKCRHLVR